MEPGVVVKFAKRAILQVYGKVSAHGSDIDPVIFTSTEDDSAGGDTNGNGSATVPSNTDWDGIKVVNNGQVEFDHVRVRYASTGILFGVGSGYLNNTQIDQCHQAIYSLGGQSLSVNNSVMEYNDYALIAYNSNISVASTTVRNSSYGFDIYAGTLNLSDSLFQNLTERTEAISSQTTKAKIERTNFDRVSCNAVLARYGSKVDFINSSVTNLTQSCGYNFYAFGSAKGAVEVNIKDSSFGPSSNSGIGVSTNAVGTVENTKVSNVANSGMVASWGGRLTVKNSVSVNNGTGLSNIASLLTVTNSIIADNLEDGIYEYGVSTTSAINNWWGSASGPYHSSKNPSGKGNDVGDSVQFTPWLVRAPNSCCSNIVFIPGLQASRLYKKGLVFENQLWEPNRNADVEKLYLDKEGNSINSGIYTRDILKRTNIGMGVVDFNVYKSFADMMDGLVGEKKINAWEALPYDWRFDVNKIISDGVKQEDGSVVNFADEVIKMASSSQTGKATIVTHSNGGLVVKALVEELKRRGKEKLIDTIIMVAAPQLGTPKAVAGILHGYDQDIAGGILLKSKTARTLGENMMGAYNLLPQGKYFETVATPVVQFDPSVDRISKLRSVYGDSITNSEALNNFMLGKEGRTKPGEDDVTLPNVLNEGLLDKAKNNHAVQDVWIPPENIKVIQLAGWGVKTLSGIKYTTRQTCIENLSTCMKKTVLDQEPVFTEDGDETVVSPSATAMSGEKFYLDLKKIKDDLEIKIKHQNILESSTTLQFVKNIVLDEQTDLSKYISVNKPVSNSNTLELVLHSPVSIDVYDNEGNHTGVISNPNPDSDLQIVQKNIPGSTYLEFGEGKYVVLDDNKSYKVTLHGLEKGFFTLDVSQKDDGGVRSTSEFKDIPTSPLMSAELVLATTSEGVLSPILKIDTDGNGEVDFSLLPGQNFSPLTYSLILKSSSQHLSKVQRLEIILNEEDTRAIIMRIESFIKEHKNKDYTNTDLELISNLMKMLIEKTK